ncbi:MAG: hypothetical protein HQ532_00675 [Candidatus Omnitrophica bacterium]|nr:hypothetical protein [Candidatus Omnitrophota bacterium]
MLKKLTLVSVSFLSLFLELCLIRWIPAHIFSIAFFSNAILIASFLGLGLGLLMSEKKRDLFSVFPWIFAISVVVVLLLKNIQVDIPADAETWIWSYYHGNRLYVPPFKISIIAILGFVFSVTIFIFIPIGQKIGKLMKDFSPLHGYTLNIIGSLLGVIGFAIVSFLNAPAFLWFLIAGLIILALFYKRRGFIGCLAIVIFIVAMVGLVEKDISWSPYYSIELVESDEEGFSLYVNQLFHQKAVNFDKETYAAEKFLFPYKWFSPERVLIIGSGTGNDVWAARKSGAKHIDAVEIDPVIVELGRERHPQLPYDSDSVRIFMDDARSFMHKSLQPYDMIVYGTLDSHATLSVTSSIRLDNYVYTHEALGEAQKLLSPDGVVVLLFSVPTKWIQQRLLETVRSVFREDEVRYMVTDPYLFNLIIFAGPGLNTALLRYPELEGALSELPLKTDIKIPLDDWPYLYLKKAGIPHLYLITLLVLIFISVTGIFVFTPLKRSRINPFFLSMGCGFLLLETKSVTTLSLLFGSTWIVNAVVFSAILFLALLANRLVMAKGLDNTKWFFGGLVLSLVGSYFFPLNSLLRLSFFMKVFAAGLLAGLPIFFAAVIFAIVFRRTKYAGIALGSNLIGAVIGGFLEYSSMLWGLNALYIVALGWYLIAGFYLFNLTSSSLSKT